MFEEPPKVGVNKKELGEDPYAEYADLIAMYETPEVPPEKRVDCEPIVTEFEAMIADFEMTHNLEALHAIVRLDPKEAPNHPVREPAKKALNPIVAKLNFLENETNITEARHDELKARYKKLSRAVGIINGGVVYHDR